MFYGLWFYGFLPFYQVLKQLGTFDPDEGEHPTLQDKAWNTVRRTAATIYEAEINSAIDYVGLQKQKALQTAAKVFAKQSEGAAPAEWIHPVLHDVTVRSASALASRRPHLSRSSRG